MKSIVFIGAERVGENVLRALLNAKKNIVAVFTAHPMQRKKIADYVDFTEIERDYPNIDFYYIINNKEPLVVDKIRSYHPDAIFVISWSQIIPIDILKIPPKGTIGLHYSLLPQRRGGAPLNWAIIDGLKESGITLYYMDKGIDSGDIIAQLKITIGSEDTVNDLLNKIKNIAPAFVTKYCDEIMNGKAPRLKQDEKKV
ncbi:methionyl-tRNA formyltransferase, partial [Acidobacteriota bacterium]